MIVDTLRFKTFKAHINGQDEYVNVLDKFQTPTQLNCPTDKYLVVIVGESPVLSKTCEDGVYRHYRDHKGESEIITPNKGKVFAISPTAITEVVNYYQ